MMEKNQKQLFSFVVALTVFLFVLMILMGSAVAEGGLNVRMTVSNPLNMERVNEPVTSGIPIPETEQIFSCDMLNIVDASGKCIPSQFVVTARWGGKPTEPNRPVKWLLVTFPANVLPMGTSTYLLRSGSRNETDTELRIISDTEKSMVIETGKARFIVNKERFHLFDTVMVDGQVVTQGTVNGIYLIDELGNSFTSFHGSPPSLLIKEAGPIRIVLQVEGKLSDAQGKTFLDYKTFLYLYADSSYARVLLTLGNHRNALARENGGGYDVFDYYGQNSVTFEEASVQIQLDSPGRSPVYLYPSDSAVKSGVIHDLSIYQDSSGTEYWNRYTAEDYPRTNSYSQFRGYRITDEQQEIDAGHQFSGWLDLCDNAKGVSVGIVDFWQNFPKALSASDKGDVALKLFPADYGSAYNFRVGEEKTTKMFFYFHKGPADEQHLSEMARALLSPMWCLASSEWYIQSGALQEFAAEPNQIEERFGQQDSEDDMVKYAYYNDRTLIADPTYTGPDSDYYPYDALWISSLDHPASIDYFNFYGWAWWGNQPLDFEAYGDGKAGPFNVKYQFDYGAWLQFLRTLDPRWKNMAEAFTSHLELLMLSEVTTLHDEERWRNAVFGMSAHMESGNENGTRNRLGPVMDTCFGAPGALLHYYLTGYPRSEEFLVRVGDYAYDFYAKTRRYEASPYLADSFYSDGTRTMGNLLTVLNEAFRYSGDLKYQELAQDIMDYFAPDKQPWINGRIPGNDEFIAPIFLMLYVNAMGQHARLTQEYSDLLQQSNLAKQRVVRFVDWLLSYGSFTYDGWLTTWYHYQLNGNNPYYSDMINNWLLEFADACAYAYAFTGKLHYLNAAKSFFHTGVNNPFYIGSALTYSDAKEAVNHAVFGHAYMYYAGFYENLPPDYEPPGISIKTPGDGDTVNGSIHITVDAFDDVGIQKVGYTLGGMNVATVWISPYEYYFDTTLVENGDYVLSAEVWDLSAKAAISRPINIRIENKPDETAPLVKMVVPSNGDHLSGTFVFEVSAEDDEGVEAVEFYVDGDRVASVTAAPYAISLEADQLGEGDHQLHASARDLSGNVGACEAITVFVKNNEPPVAVIQCVATGVYQVGDSISFDGSDSHDPDDDPLTWIWTFGDDTVEVHGPKAGHVYEKEGVYEVTLTVSDGTVDTVARKTIAIYGSGTIASLILQQGETYVNGGNPYEGVRDAHIRRTDETSDGSYGGGNILINYNGFQRDYCSVIRFSLKEIRLPEGTVVVSATLALTPKIKETGDVYLSPLLKDWVEGTGTYSNTRDGVSWHTVDGVRKWETSGGDFDETTDYGFGPNGIVTKAVQGEELDLFDITPLVVQWLKQENDNHGVILYVPEIRKYTQVTYFSKEAIDHTTRPKLTIHYLVSDETAPLVKMVVPSNGDHLSGTFVFEVSAEDDEGVEAVEFYVDGDRVASVTAAPYAISLEADQLGEGDHQLHAFARDLSGNVGACEAITVFVKNNEPPVAVIQCVAAGVYQVGDSISFDGSDSHDPDDDPLTWIWTFGDDTVEVHGPKAGHVYEKEGVYEVTLTVSDGTVDTVARKTIAIYGSGTIASLILQQGETYVNGGNPYEGVRDAHIRRTDETSDGSYGGGNILINYNGLQRDYCSVIRFSLEDIRLPEGTVVVSATLALTPKIKETGDVYLSPLLKDWVEGTGTYSNTRDGVSWHTVDGVRKWETSGGDFDETTDYGFGPNGIVTKAVQGEELDLFDITPLVVQWLKQENDNHGVILYVPEIRKYTQVTYFSKEAIDHTTRPKLTIHYIILPSP